MAEEKKTVLDTDDTARKLAAGLIRTARHGALAVLQAGSGHPFASRVAVATDSTGAPVILVSRLSGHTSGLLEDPRCCVLLGEPGKGDPLAHPRISVVANAEQITREDPRHAAIRGRFLRRHPKSALYADFGDFMFLRLAPQSASLNGGFGKAYQLSADDILIDSPAIADLSATEESAVEHMNTDHADAVALYANRLAGKEGEGWKVATIDAAGFDLIRSDSLCRIEFDAILTDAGRLAPEMAALARRARDE